MTKVELVKLGIKEIKKLPKEEFMKVPNATEERYEQIHNSKEGWISIKRRGDGAGNKGIVEAFGEGLGCIVTNAGEWWATSPIEKIDWENHTFKTKNSIYDFEFKPFEQIRKDEIKFHEHLDDESKSN